MVEIIDLTKDSILKKYNSDIKKYYVKTLKLIKMKDIFDLSLIIVGKNRIKTINNKYRNINRETDVISFAEIDSNEGIVDNYLGDIFINKDRVILQAKTYKHSIKREYCFLFVHGLLHLFGYDHMNLKDEKIMFDLQDKIIGDLK